MTALMVLLLLAQAETPAKAPPVRGLHLTAPAKKDFDLFAAFLRDVLAKEGVNTLILEFDFSFDFTTRPEFANPGAPGRDDVAKLAKACRGSGITLIPEINCLGHQSWAKRNGALLSKHPEFDETPGKFPENRDLYCRSYCPLHPQVHEVLFALMDEVAGACEAKAFHVGMDEVFIVADRDCPRCGGKDPAELFAGEATLLHDHLRKSGLRMWMWGDRLIDGKATQIGKWEASENGTAAAVDRVPKDIVICDWHYEKEHGTPRFFAEKGFDVVACPWRRESVALGQLAQIRSIESTGHALGVVQTTWCGFAPFREACAAGDAKATGDAARAARCFRALFQAMR
jgi:hypothetical protein